MGIPVDVESTVVGSTRQKSMMRIKAPPLVWSVFFAFIKKL